MAKAIGPRRITGLLGSTALRDLVRRARHVPAESVPETQSEQALADFLPPALKGRVHMVLEQGHLLLLAENNAVAQLLRFQGPGLARRCGAVDWRVRVSPLPAPGQSAPPSRAPLPMPDAAARALREAADGIDDPALSDSLRRLAQRAGNNRGTPE